MDEPLQKTLVDVVNLLVKERLPYALIGGLAISLRGQPRMTADVDLIILADVPRSLTFLQSLETTLFKPLFADVADVVQTAFILPLRHRLTGVRVDLALGLSGFESQAVGRAQKISLGGAEVSVATAEDLLIMKALAGRPQDDQDLQGLVMAQGHRLDWEYCLNLAAQLGEAVGQDLVTRVRALRSELDN